MTLTLALTLAQTLAQTLALTLALALGGPGTSRILTCDLLPGRS